MLGAAKLMYQKMLEKASGDLERVTPQPCECLHAEATRDKRQCPRPRTSNEKSCPRSEAPCKRPCSTAETLVEKPCSRSETAGEVLRSRSETISPSRGPQEQVADDYFRKQLGTLYRSGEAEQKGKTRNFDMYIGPGSDGSSADKLLLDLKFNPWDTAISFRLEWRSMSKTVFTQYDLSESWCAEQSNVRPDDVKTFIIDQCAV